ATDPQHEGVVPAFATLTQAADDDEEDDPASPPFAALPGFVPCPDCGGARLNREARSVRFAGKGPHDVTALTVADALGWFEALPTQQTDAPAEPLLLRARAVLRAEITTRLRFLDAVGLGYLTLDRPAPTLSGGEV